MPASRLTLHHPGIPWFGPPCDQSCAECAPLADRSYVGGDARVASRLTVNVIANYVGAAWSSVLQLVLVPVYLKLLGAEQYGLVGFFATLQAVLAVLDLGLAPAINRELARRSALGRCDQETRDLVKTLETVYWGVAALLGAAVAVASSWLASSWVNVNTVPIAEVKLAIAVMGLTLALQWPTSMYGGGLLGLERQALVSGINAGMATLASGGAALLLVFVSRTAHAFFVWRAAMTLVQVALLRHMLWRALRSEDKAEKARFRLSSLASIWRFSLGMAGVMATAIVLLNTDKIILSKTLSLESLGYYTLAASAVTILPQLVMPIFTAAFPRLSHLVAVKDEQAQRSQFHLCAQLVSVVLAPVATTFVVFSREILALWTWNETAASVASPVLSALAIGGMLNALMVMPSALQLANGWTKLALKVNVLVIAVSVPYTILAATHAGMVGAASGSIVMNALTLAIATPLTFARLLSGSGWRWLRRDVALPVSAAAAACLVVWWWMPGHGSRLLTAAKIMMALAVSFGAAFLSAADVRANALAFWKSTVGKRVES